MKSLKIPKGVIRIRKSQDRQHNGKKEKKNKDLQNTTPKHDGKSGTVSLAMI